MRIPSLVPVPVAAVVAGILVAQLATLATTVYLHRASAHRALKLRPPLTFAFRVITWICVGIKPREWVAVHRKHHAFTDVEGDPHSPKLLGWVRVQLTNAALYRREARNPATVGRYAKDMPPDWWDRHLFDKPVLGLGIGIGFLVVVLGPIWGLVAALVHTVSYLMSNAAVNAVGHRFGRRPYDNSAGNVGWLALITAGEGWHNNHHAAPTSARLGHRWWEVDLGWWAISLFRMLGLAKVRLERVVFVSPKHAERVAA
jgi:stearoyl-CoA desaturase (Delta-9 desaturase)